MRKIRNKRALIIGGAFLFLGIGVTIAYNADLISIPNLFQPKEYKTEVTESFVSPGDWKPCDAVPKTVKAKNSGRANVAVRLKLKEYWRNAEDTANLPLEKDGVRLATIVFQNENDWELKDDGYYYYKQELAPGEETSSLLKEVVLNCNANLGGINICTNSESGQICEGNNEYNKAKYHLEVRIETEQADVAAEDWANRVSESAIMLDVARRYYPVSEIKQYIDTLSAHKHSSLQLHFTDDENVGIECTYLDQTVANATLENGVYTNPATGRRFLSYAQVREIMNYADSKGVTFIPEIEMPAHMKGFFDLAEIKFGYDAVRSHENGFAWGTGDEIGNIDIVRQQGKNFIYALYDEYTEFFSDREYFHMGFDEYTFRIDEKIAFANEMYAYLANKGFKVRMWSDAVTKTNIDQLNRNIEIIYWGWWDDVEQYGYATVPDFQERGFTMLVTNRFYLFFVPSVQNMTAENNARTLRDIRDTWELESWNYTFPSTLANHDGIRGGIVCIWGENSAGVSDAAIREQGTAMYNAMFPKLEVPKEALE